jgi:hypothetical protein
VTETNGAANIVQAMTVDEGAAKALALVEEYDYVSFAQLGSDILADAGCAKRKETVKVSKIAHFRQTATPPTEAVTRRPTEAKGGRSAVAGRLNRPQRSQRPSAGATR